MDNIKDYLSYDPKTGLFIWIKKPSNVIKMGSMAGNINSHGYVIIKYKGKLLNAQRLAWFFTYGEYPKLGLDHINQIKDDNRICNLREASKSENQQNVTRRHINNTSKYRGVTVYIHDKSKWKAQIKVNGKGYSLGIFPTPEEAHAAYLAAKAIHHPYWAGAKDMQISVKSIVDLANEAGLPQSLIDRHMDALTHFALRLRMAERRRCRNQLRNWTIDKSLNKPPLLEALAEHD